MNWDDLRFVLALGRSGTFKDAAESLGVHYTSVARKIKQFEESLGTRLFDSHPRQQVLTPHGEKLMQVAERIENEIFVLDRELLGKESQLSGLLRISTVEPIAMAHCKDFADFIDLHPDVELEIIADTTIRDLSKRESDIALRATKNPPEHLLGRQVATMRFAPFAMPELIERQGAGTPIEDWPWVHWTMEGSRPMWKSWLEKVNSGNGRVIIVSNGAVFNQMVESDALAIIQAASLPDVIFIGGKTVEQQQLQTIKRLRELAVKHQGACQEQLVSLLLELNILISNRKGGIISAIDGVLEDATNGLSAECRIAIDTAKVYLKVSI
ncbi:MAG: DNA-binding transcriptional LysR family regulator, partial [Chitinophagales bacterium]